MQQGERLPRVWYLSDGYISLSAAAKGYQRALRELGCLTDDPERAEIVVLHRDLSRLERGLAALPGLRAKYTIGLLVWETNELPARLQPVIRALNEVWTPSLYSARAFIPLHRRVFAMPHAVEAPGPVPPGAAAEVDGWLASATPTFDVFCLGKVYDRRKNTSGVIAAVDRVASRIPGIRLIFKLDWSLGRRIVRREHRCLYVHGYLSDAQMQALMARAAVVVSGHHAEGWGLNLSEALAMGTPVVATGYSGNLTFCSPRNSYLVGGALARVGKTESGTFPPTSIWAQPSGLSLEEQLFAAYEQQGSPQQESMKRQGRRDVALYSPRHLRTLLKSRLREIGKQLGLRSAAN